MNLYRNKKIDLLTFKHLEQELLGLGQEISKINKMFDERNLDQAGIVYVRRTRWLNKIIDELNILYSKVDKTTKRIMRLLYIDNETFESVSEKTSKNIKQLRLIHRLIVNAVAERIGMIGIGENVLKETSRYLDAETKKKVIERYEGKCAVCSTRENLHFHHIEYFSEGGTNEADNLMLLCASCHAEKHKGERAYYALKTIAEG